MQDKDAKRILRNEFEASRRKLEALLQKADKTTLDQARIERLSAHMSSLYEEYRRVGGEDLKWNGTTPQTSRGKRGKRWVASDEWVAAHKKRQEEYAKEASGIYAGEQSTPQGQRREFSARKSRARSAFVRRFEEVMDEAYGIDRSEFVTEFTTPFSKAFKSALDAFDAGTRETYQTSIQELQDIIESGKFGVHQWKSGGTPNFQSTRAEYRRRFGARDVTITDSAARTDENLNHRTNRKARNAAKTAAETTDIKKDVTVGKVIKSKAILSEEKAAAEKTFGKILKGTGKTLWIGGGLLLGIGTIAHFTNKLSDKARERHQVAEARRKQRKEDAGSRKYMYAGTDMDISPRAAEILFEMHQQRLRHYKQGNAKYYS